MSKTVPSIHRNSLGVTPGHRARSKLWAPTGVVCCALSSTKGAEETVQSRKALALHAVNPIQSPAPYVTPQVPIVKIPERNCPFPTKKLRHRWYIYTPTNLDKCANSDVPPTYCNLGSPVFGNLGSQMLEQIPCRSNLFFALLTNRASFSRVCTCQRSLHPTLGCTEGHLESLTLAFILLFTLGVLGDLW